MTLQVNMAEAKARLSELVARAEAGETIVIARAGRPAARIAVDIPVDTKTGHRRIGALAHLGQLRDPMVLHGPDPDFDPDKPILF